MFTTESLTTPKAGERIITDVLLHESESLRWPVLVFLLVKLWCKSLCFIFLLALFKLHKNK